MKHMLSDPIFKLIQCISTHLAWRVTFSKVFEVNFICQSTSLLSCNLARLRHLSFLCLRRLFCLRFWLNLLLLRVLLSLLAKHISEPKLTYSISVRNVAVSSTDVALFFEQIIVIQIRLRLLCSFIKIAEGTFSQNKVSFVRIVLNRSSQNHLKWF